MPLHDEQVHTLHDPLQISTCLRPCLLSRQACCTPLATRSSTCREMFRCANQAFDEFQRELPLSTRRCVQWLPADELSSLHMAAACNESARSTS